MKRQNNRRRKKEIKKFSFTLLMLGLLLSSLYLFVFFSQKTVIINPLAIKNIGQLEKIENGLMHKNISFSKIEQDNDLSYKVFIKDNGIVFLSEKKDIGNQIDSLQLILSRLTIEGKRFKILDFRFDKPIISY
ncbi:MAG: hypothetical protein A2W22_03710 [Candidatus Levybacteria bacterium RBG_16_35_11]|nr:MAG: hypothetical protein A2W22_03710 [Candidatus Levybacteria bacterium RBG_16_35_11]